jgi:shikimate dehydrogenase
MRTLGIIGNPLSHSFSKKFFDQKIAAEKLNDVQFKEFQLPDISALEIVLNAERSLQGFAVTIPYKKEVIDFLTESSDEVKKIGACNCVRIKEGKLYGYNTDIIGFEDSFKKHLQPQHTKALLLGTGGAAAAVEYVLRKLDIDFLNLSRKPFANQLTYSDIDERLLKEYKIIINTTPLGTFPNVEEAPDIPYHLITSEHYCFDLIYNPSVTKFLKLSAERGAVTQNGYEMLILQAEKNWKIWNS